MDAETKLTPIQLMENLQTQLDELESLQAMFYNPGEIKIEDPLTLEDIKYYLNQPSILIPGCLDLSLNIVFDDLKFQLCINLPHEYPFVEPEVFVRNDKLNRQQHTNINKDLNNFLSELEKGEPCIYYAVDWLRENYKKYVVLKPEAPKVNSKNKEELVRYWIYAHHIYSKSKRREILDLAHILKLTGFCMPGKPGVICIEGNKRDCDEWWQSIRSLCWKKIFCKVSEENKEELKDFLKFDKFEEVAFQSNGVTCNHTDMGQLYKFLEDHKVAYIFKEIFGVDAKSTN